MKGDLSSLQSTCSDREANLDKQCTLQQSEIQGKQDLINTLQNQLTSVHEMRTSFESNFKSALEKQNTIQPPSTSVSNTAGSASWNGVDLTDIPINTRKVFIFHDSLVNDINNSLMGRDDVNVTKVWAPTLDEIREEVAQIENADTIIVQALTRDLGNLSIDVFLPKLYETIDICLTKSEKVIISLVVRRYDKKDIETKVDFANASIKFKYLNNNAVLICIHDNLDDKKYRKYDQLHLNESGTSRYANNFKYKIAEALGITIERKKRFPDNHDRAKFGQRGERSNRNERNGYRSQYDGRYRANDNNYGYRYDEF